ncbi:unnamed protein product [Medioppia subpectinata]|uniref:Iron-binding zinc finger CDGSH type domain-containing protein n=1 Tax=Medioppia subpectinata TaxID=1979941 RepID=A0A7R9Q854_9ACAR|nr:unnamed protein product [Medioppia subpectinata]CAG2116526.1 unnamed protein product [Medioppia subpectinata]
MVGAVDQSHLLNCQYLPWVGTAVAVGYAVYLTLRTKSEADGSDGKPCVNLCLHKGKDKVVDSLDIEDLGDKSVFCRCWRSKKFPYCDGAHNDHNKDTGDNVGPLIIQKKAN